jgi:hypothetical protein
LPIFCMRGSELLFKPLLATSTGPEVNCAAAFDPQGKIHRLGAVIVEYTQSSPGILQETIVNPGLKPSPHRILAGLEARIQLQNAPHARNRLETNYSDLEGTRRSLPELSGAILSGLVSRRAGDPEFLLAAPGQRCGCALLSAKGEMKFRRVETKPQVSPLRFAPAAHRVRRGDKVVCETRQTMPSDAIRNRRP